ncbi:PREDICTED: uncharacterized protein LOC106113589 [Papilio xuthus]|uniref:Uncharacterized protein LOC106113589 n=1 Tax=Papilio xuthus TaxID=66420 RepID=A0AAJ6YZ84_PAPXU|nr:PREDICTED: uncharacterized protein LOC106113589 [Papilio xuthus]
MKLIKTLLLMKVAICIQASIVGVTYMDDFDFEERYRNVNECNPIYWHPLHLPKDCIDMYEKLIRSNLGSMGPLQLFKDRLFDEVEDDSEESYEYHHFAPEYLLPPVISGKKEVIYENRQPLSPVKKMIEMMRSDAMTIPTAPEIGIAPQYGPIAVYHQPVSKQSEKAIKEIAEAYQKAMMPHKTKKHKKS